MSVVPGNVKSLSSAARFMEVTIRGKVEASRRHASKYYTRLITPAEDAYTRPQIVEVRSGAKLGNRDDEITVSCKLGGYTKKAFRATDKETGEISMVTPVDLTLDALE